jgi:hypothetical protein
MKNTMCLALIMLAVLPTAAQGAAGQNGWANDQSGNESARDYAARVDGLLREVHASLQRISDRTEAGELRPEQARQLKLAATRDMISRLDAISAVYDVRFGPANRGNLDATSVAVNAPRSGHGVHRTSPPAGTVSVEELKREAAPVASVPHGEGAAR